MVVEIALQAEAGIPGEQSLLSVAPQDLHHPGTRHSGKQNYSKALADDLRCCKMMRVPRH